MPRKVRALQDLWAEGRAGIQFSVLGILLRSSSVALSPSQEGDKALPQTHRDVAGGCHLSSSSGDPLCPWKAMLVFPTGGCMR